MGAKIKGITIEIGGQTTNLQASLKAASEKGKEAATELSKINSSLKFNPENVDLLGQKMDVLRDRISATEDTLHTLKDAQSSIEEQFKKGDIGADQYREFQRELIETESKLENFKDQLTKTEKDVKQHDSVMGKLKDAYEDVKDKANKLKEAHPHLASAFDKTNEAAKNLATGGLKAAGGLTAGAVAGVTAITAAGTAAAKELYNAAYEAAQAGDAIDEASQRMGVSAEKFQELQYAAKMSGVEVATLETAAKTLAKSGKDMDLSEAINQIASIKDESERTEKAIELFGSKAAYQMGPMLSQGAEGVKALTDQAHELGLVMSDEAVSASASFNDSLDNLTGAFSAVKNNMAADFLPGITEVMDGLTALLTGEEGATELIKSGVEDIMSNVSEKIPEVAELLTGLVGSIAEIAPDLVLSLSNGILDNLDELTNSAFTMLDTLANGLLTEDNIKTLVSSAMTIVSSFASFLGDNSELIVDSSFIMIESLINGLLENDNISKLATSTLDIVTALVTGLIDHAPNMIEGAFSLIGALVGAIIDYDWWGVAKDIFEGIKDGLKQLITGEPDDYDKPRKGGGGSHAGGLAYVPYDGYVSELHEGERILTAAENRNYNREQQEKEAEFATLNRKIDAVTSSAQAASKRPIEIIATGSARGIARGLTYYVEEEEERQGVIKKNK